MTIEEFNDLSLEEKSTRIRDIIEKERKDLRIVDPRFNYSLVSIYQNAMEHFGTMENYELIDLELVGGMLRVIYKEEDIQVEAFL